jgi:transposase
MWRRADFLELEVRRLDCRHCGKVKRERLDFLADNPLYTKRFAYYVGRRCRSATIKDVAAELKLDWHTVKTLEQQYMEAQLKRAGTPSPRVIGIDEIAIRKGHTYRIVVSDLLRGRPIWFGGKDRSEASMSEFSGARPALHQGPEIHVAVAQGEPDARRQEGFEGAAVGQQAAQHGLCPQGELRSTVELRTRRLGPLL